MDREELIKEKREAWLKLCHERDNDPRIKRAESVLVKMRHIVHVEYRERVDAAWEELAEVRKIKKGSTNYVRNR